MCDNVCIEVNETVENISIEVRDFSVLNIISEDANNSATIGSDGLLFVSESGVTNHSELILDDGTNPHGTTKSDVGLSNVDNTSDVDKPISTATQQALDLKANLTDIPDFADQTEVNAGVVTDKTISPNALSGWWTYVKGLSQTFAQKITFSSGALFSPQVAPTYERGRVYFDDVNDCFSFMDSISGTSVQVGYEVLMRARNNTGATILNGSVVYISGAIGQNSTVALAQANTLPTSEIIGVATHDIANNTVGKICVFGLVNDLNTNSFTDGQMLYLSATVVGGLTSTIPASPNFVVALGVVEHAHPTQGKILVKPQRALANNNALGTAKNVPPTQNAVKTAIDLKLDKVTTAGVERVYTINADGSQGAKATSEFKDVLEFADLVAFPTTGESGKIYIALDTNLQYRWSGSAYVQIGGSSGFEQQLQRYWYSVMANTLNTTLLQVNNTNSFTISGTASVVSRSGTLYYNSIAMNNYLSATANGSNCGIKNSNQVDGTYLEGFDSSFVFINNDTNINCETTVGYYGLLSAIPNIDKVNYTTDFVGVGNDVGDTNLSFYCRRNTYGVSFTKVDCGSGFPAHTTTDAYIFRMQMSRGYDGSGRTLKMTITNIITGAEFTHTFTDSQIPHHTRVIAMVVNRSNRNTGVATNIRFSKWHQTKYIY